MLLSNDKLKVVCSSDLCEASHFVRPVCIDQLVRGHTFLES